MNLCKQQLKQHRPIAVSNAHAHLLHLVCTRGQINQLAKNLASLLTVSLKAGKTRECKKPNTDTHTSVRLT